MRITGVRNFEYRSRNDFTVRYETREVQLSHLTAVDFYVSYWSEGLVAHTFVSFIFDNVPPLSIFIETRPEVGEGFNPIASLFKQFELIYVVGEERDLVGVRTNYRHEASQRSLADTAELPFVTPDIPLSLRPSAARNRRPSNGRVTNLKFLTDFFYKIGHERRFCPVRTARRPFCRDKTQR